MQQVTRRQKALNKEIPTDFNQLENFAYGKSHFFSPNTRRFFKSRNVGWPQRHPLTKGVLFIDSTKAGFDDPSRIYNVHFARYEKNGRRFEFTISAPLVKCHTSRLAEKALSAMMKEAVPIGVL